jgi:hypothetical protein
VLQADEPSPSPEARFELRYGGEAVTVNFDWGLLLPKK